MIAKRGLAKREDWLRVVVDCYERLRGKEAMVDGAERT